MRQPSNENQRVLTAMQWAVLLTVRQDDLGYYPRYLFTADERRCALGLQRRGYLRALARDARQFRLTAAGLRFWNEASRGTPGPRKASPKGAK